MTENKEWHEKRLNGIGGSEASVILGINPWISRLELWNTKVNRTIKEDNDNPNFKWGKILEPVISDEYQKETGRVVAVVPRQLISKTHSFMNANIDRLILDYNDEERGLGVLEIKTKGEFVNWEDDEIPIYYMSQIQHYLAVTGYKWASFVAFDMGKKKLIIHDVDRDDALISKIIEEETKFWKLVQNKIPPEPEPTKACESFLKNSHKASEPVTIDISDNPTATAYAEKLNEVKLKYKELETIELECKTYFMNRMKEAEKAIGIDYSITWKSPKDKTVFDIDRFKLEHSKLYKEYTHTEPSTRRFTFKYKKE